MTCEECWADAYRESYSTGEAQADIYARLVKERDSDEAHVERNTPQSNIPASDN